MKLQCKTFIESLIASSLFVVITCAYGDTIPSCYPPEEVLSASLAPPAVWNALKERIGDVVQSGMPFDATDVAVTGHNRRLIFIWNYRMRWIVATEHGGRGYNDPVFAYDLKADGSATFVEERVAFPGTVCTTAISLLNLVPQK